ncbi:MAG: hypothetical protein AAF502_24105 [Bacteroidota bacterium]
MKKEYKIGVVHSSFPFPTRELEDVYMCLGKKRYSGSVIKYYDKPKVEFEGYYREGYRTGTWRHYYESGTLKSVIQYDSTSIFELAITEYFPNEQLKLDIQMKDIIDTLHIFEYYDNGQLKYKHLYKSDTIDVEYYEKYSPFGERFAYFQADSILELKDPYTFDLLEIGFFNAKGNKHGNWVTYYKNGKKKEEKNFKNGEKYGTWYEYNEEGEIIFEAKYLNGYSVGSWRSFNGKSKLIEPEKYD